MGTWLREHGGATKETQAPEQCSASYYLDACANGDLASIKQYKDQGGDLRATDYDGRSALHLVSANGDVTTAAYLLGEGAPHSLVDRFGR